MKYINRNAIRILLLFLLPVKAFTQDISISTGANITVSGNAFLVVNNCGFTNNGSFIAGAGTVQFKGSNPTAASFIGGSSITSFYNLDLNKSANGIQLNQQTAVSNLLRLLNGDSVFLNTYNISLGSTGMIAGENATRKITGMTGGYVEGIYTLNAPASVTPGNLGIMITSASNLGSTLIRRGHIPQTNGFNYGIARYYDIVPSNNTGLNATIRFFYNQSELIGLDETTLIPFSSADSGTTWHINGYTILDVMQNFIEQNAYDSLNRITLASISSPLPVNLLMLSAQADAGQNLIHWSTDHETNMRLFEIERSGSELNFVKIGTVPAKGNTVNISQYTCIDDNPLQGTNYYRLKIIEQNGSFSYSKTVAVKQAVAASAGAFPNPAQSILNIEYYAPEHTTAAIKMADMSGTVIWESKVTLNKGVNTISRNIAAFPAGMYIIEISTRSSSKKTLVFLKQ